MTPAPVIALFGISGVGKTHLARRIVRARPDLLRLSASALLKSTFHTTGEKLRTAPSSDVVNNQSALASALAAAREGCWQRPVLLEAHAVIDNDCELIDVPLRVMEAIGVAGILSLAAPSAEIETRRRRDRRTRPARSAAELERQQQRSLAVSRRFAQKLGVPFEVVEPRDLDVSLRLIDTVCGAIQN